MKRLSVVVAAGMMVLGLARGRALGQTCVGTEPPSDHCTAPRVIPWIPGQHVVYMDTTNATGTDEFCGSNVAQPVWFELTAPSSPSGPVTVSTCHPATTYDTVIQVWRGGDDGCNAMLLESCNDDSDDPECDNGCSFRSSKVTFTPLADTRYRFAVASYGVGTPASGCLGCLGVVVTIEPVCGDEPSNLDCFLARELPGTRGAHSIEIDAQDAITLPGEPTATCGTNLGKTVWFKTTPTVDGVVTFSTCNPGTTYDTVVHAYSGSCNDFLFLEDCNDDSPNAECNNGCGTGGPRGSIVQFEATAGVEYYIQVGAYNQGIDCTDFCLEATLTIEDACDAETTPPLAEITSPVSLDCNCPPIPIEGTAADPETFDHYVLEYRPAGSTGWSPIDSSDTPVVAGALGTWNTSGLTQGYYLLRLSVWNTCGMELSDVQLVWISSFFDNLILRSPVHNAVVGGNVCLDGSANDNFCFDNYTADYRPVGSGPFIPVDPSSPTYSTPVINDPLATWSPSGVADGLYELRLDGTDQCGNGATQTIAVSVDNTPPVSVISSPLSCQCVDGTVPVVGTASDANLASWVLQYTGDGAHDWVTLNTGTSSVVDGVLANWNTSGLDVCSYALRLVVTDEAILNCNSAIHHRSEYTVLVDVGDCVLCGNGVLDADQGEECDDGGTANGDGCDENCQIEGPCCFPQGQCVDFTVEEICSEVGGSYLGNGVLCADIDCPACGNGVVEGNEECDDGNAIPGDGCDDQCRLEGPCCFPGGACAENTVDTICESFGGTYAGDGLTCGEATCPSCGNGLLEAGEECDDGNNVGSDGCNGDCELEGPCCFPGGECTDKVDETLCDSVGGSYSGDGLTCATAVCPVCGNGNVEGDEACDDGNTANGDGCDQFCRVEGACCFASLSICVDNTWESNCIAAGGRYDGDGTTCAQASCP